MFHIINPIGEKQVFGKNFLFNKPILIRLCSEKTKY